MNGYVAIALGLLMSSKSNSAPAMHYFDITGQPAITIEPIWDQLQSYWGQALPDRIVVNVVDNFGGSYDCKQNQMTLTSTRFVQQPLFAGAHESTHLALCYLTGLANTLEPFRFIDEGTATVWEYRIGGAEPYLKKKAFAFAKKELSAGHIQFSVVENWKHYFGDPDVDPQHLNFNAYFTGTTFYYAFSGKFGDSAYKLFLSEVGKTHDLQAALSNSVGISLKEAQKLWAETIRDYK